MKNLIFTFLLFCTCFSANGQIDSTYHVTVVNQFSIDKASANGVPLSIYSSEIMIKKMKDTFIPTYRNKSLHGENAHQYGASYYRGFEQSYFNVGGFFSSEELFPTISYNAGYYMNLGKGLELKVAYDGRSFSTEEISHMGIIGARYERNRYTFNYNAYQPLEQDLSHQFSIRKNMKRPENFLQISYSNGQIDSENDFNRLDNRLSSLSMSAGKSLQESIRLSLASSLSKVNIDNEDSLYIGYSISIGIEIQ